VGEGASGTLTLAYDKASAARRFRWLAVLLVLILLVLGAGTIGEVDLPKLAANFSRFTNYIYRILPDLTLSSFIEDLRAWYWNFKTWIGLLGETLLIAYLGTLMGATAAFFLCFAAATNLTRNQFLVFVVRRWLEFCRTVPVIVFGFIFVIAFGIGPMPGVLAIAIHTMGALGKLFAEVVENIDMKPVESVTATGARPSYVIRFAALPQVSSSFTSYALLRYEINVREATLMGFVGGGGIGQDLLASIRQFFYSDVSAILLMIIATVMIIDSATNAIRHRLIGQEAE
jgi:phosphonate transport system permease protein